MTRRRALPVSASARIGRPLLDRLLLRFCMANLGYVVVERLLRRRIGELDRPDPLPVSLRPCPAAPAALVALVPGVPPADEQVGEAVLGAREVVVHVLERAG